RARAARAGKAEGGGFMRRIVRAGPGSPQEAEQANRLNAGQRATGIPRVSAYLLRILRIAASCAANVDSSASTVAISSSLEAFLRASSARAKASRALASSRSLPRIAV